MKSRDHNGFILPLAALGVALLALGLAMSLPSAEQAGQELRKAGARLALERAAIITEARVTYLLLTEPVGLRGLEIDGGRLAADGTFVAPGTPASRRELVFDGRGYGLDLAEGGRFIIRIQDEAGLIGIDTADTGLLEELARVCTLGAAERRALTRFREEARKGRASSLHNLIKPAFLAAISTESGNLAPHLPTAPASVLLAANRGNNATTQAMMTRRNNSNETVNMAVNYNQNDYITRYGAFIWGSVSNRLRIYVEPFQSSLNIHLPIYSYTSRVSTEDSDPQKRFLPQGSMINAGSRTQCYQSPGEAIVPLPYPGQPVS